MNLALLSFLLLLNLNGSKTPNFYPSFLGAKEASKNYQKDMLIYFSKSGCTECTTAWAAYENDQMATKIFISTIVDIQDFDGVVIMDKYGLTSAPSWAILDYEGNLKQKWSGEWKNPHVRPTTPPQEPKPAGPPIKEFKATTVTSKTEPAQATQTASATSVPSANTTKVAAPTNSTTTSTVTVTPAQTASAPVVATPVAAPSAGYVLQAGYFGSEANATKLVNDLNAKGFKGYSIKTLTQNGSMFYRVISTVYATESEANTVVQTLSTVGVKATVKKSSEIRYSPLNSIDEKAGRRNARLFLFRDSVIPL